MKCSVANKEQGRRASRRASRREAILAIAKRSFFTHGYSATSMSAIAAELGGSKGTLWNYFPSKEELFAAVIDEASAVFRARLVEILAPSNDLRSTLTSFCMQLLEKMSSPEGIALYRLIIAEAERFPELGRIFFDHAVNRGHRLLADYLEDAMQRGQLRKDDPLLSARALISLCALQSHQQLLMGAIDKPSQQARMADAERGVTLFLRAMAEPAVTN